MRKCLQLQEISSGAFFVPEILSFLYPDLDHFGILIPIFPENKAKLSFYLTKVADFDIWVAKLFYRK